jgi:DNA polymerase-4
MTDAHTWPRVIVHADMDAFYAAIEQLDQPALRGKPVLVGPPSPRGVVLTASYEARPAGVGSAMPMAIARRRCPEAIVVPPRFDRYQEVSRVVMRTFADFSPAVEPVSLDEAFLDMTGSEGIFGAPETIGRKLKDAVREATGGLTVSVGISGTKYVAKVASAHAKPDGLTVVPESGAKTWLAPQPVSVLWGAGPKTVARLAGLGLETVGDVAAFGAARLEAELGRMGRHFFELAAGRDPRPVDSARSARSLSSERTLTTDVAAPAALESYVRQAAEVVARRLRGKGQVAGGVRVKLKTHDFRVLTRQRSLETPTQASAVIGETARALLAAFDEPGPFRLIGVAAYDMRTQAADRQVDWLTPSGTGHRLDAVLDELKRRFGPGAVRRAADLKRRTVFTDEVNLDFLRTDSKDDEEA